MDRLWAPWRIKYVKSKKSRKCIFCQSLKSAARFGRHKNYVIYKGAHSFSVLNIFPYNNGHAMAAPIRHIRQLSQLRTDEALDLFKTLMKTKEALDKALEPQGYNIGINISKNAGAGEAGHLHIHIVPRWIGDANFMATVSDTKVISQSLDELYKELKRCLRRRKTKC